MVLHSNGATCLSLFSSSRFYSCRSLNMVSSSWCFWYLFPELIVLLQESQGSGLKASQQDFEFFLQFRRFSGLCRHVAPVYLRGDRAKHDYWAAAGSQSSDPSCDVRPAFSPNFRYGLSSTPGWLGCTCSESADTKPAEKRQMEDDERFSHRLL